MAWPLLFHLIISITQHYNNTAHKDHLTHNLKSQHLTTTPTINMKFTTILAAAALTLTVSAKSPLPPPRPLLEGTVNSDRDCKKSITKWTIDENAHDRCVVFDEELEGVEDYAVKSLRVDALNNDKCGRKKTLSSEVQTGC